VRIIDEDPSAAAVAAQGGAMQLAPQYQAQALALGQAQGQQGGAHNGFRASGRVVLVHPLCACGRGGGEQDVMVDRNTGATEKKWVACACNKAKYGKCDVLSTTWRAATIVTSRRSLRAVAAADQESYVLGSASGSGSSSGTSQRLIPAIANLRFQAEKLAEAARFGSDQVVASIPPASIAAHVAGCESANKVKVPSSPSMIRSYCLPHCPSPAVIPSSNGLRERQQELRLRPRGLRAPPAAGRAQRARCGAAAEGAAGR